MLISEYEFYYYYFIMIVKDPNCEIFRVPLIPYHLPHESQNDTLTVQSKIKFHILFERNNFKKTF